MLETVCVMGCGPYVARYAARPQPVVELLASDGLQLRPHGKLDRLAQDVEVRLAVRSKARVGHLLISKSFGLGRAATPETPRAASAALRSEQARPGPSGKPGLPTGCCDRRGQTPFEAS